VSVSTELSLKDTALERWQSRISDMADLPFADALCLLQHWLEAGAQLRERLLAQSPSNEHVVIARCVERAFAEARASFVAAHTRPIFDLLTCGGLAPSRIDEFLRKLGSRFPQLMPSERDLADERRRPLAEKLACELSIGLVCSELLKDPIVGQALARWTRMPRPESLPLAEIFAEAGQLDLKHAYVERRGHAAFIEIRRAEFLNAEDDELNAALEIATDVALLDPKTKVCVLRGGLVNHKKYQGRRVFCSGVNLTKLYAGEIPFTFYIERELGFVSKLLRGLYLEPSLNERRPGLLYEKPWIAAVDAHAIGGGLQLLLVCDHVIASEDAFVSMPARSEGFIPGVANLRLPQFVGRRLANQLIYRNAKLFVTSHDGGLLVDEVKAPEEVDNAIASVITEMTSSGIAGLVSNRRAFCESLEPIEVFCRYMSLFAREQVLCMFGADVAENLDRMWIRRR
jgi:(3,5-dihydroxyphenyl)acetyl-CoA 1,2-dioxygenase